MIIDPIVDKAMTSISMASSIPWGEILWFPRACLAWLAASRGHSSALISEICDGRLSCIAFITYILLRAASKGHDVYDWPCFAISICVASCEVPPRQHQSDRPHEQQTHQNSLIASYEIYESTRIHGVFSTFPDWTKREQTNVHVNQWMLDSLAINRPNVA